MAALGSLKTYFSYRQAGASESGFPHTHANIAVYMLGNLFVLKNIWTLKISLNMFLWFASL